MGRGRFLGRSWLLACLAVVVLSAVVAIAGCSSSSPAESSSSSVGPSIPSSPASTPATDSTVAVPEPSVARLPVGEPVDVVRCTSAPYAWNAVLAGHIVAYVESDSYGFLQPGQAQQPTQTAVIKTLDLETGEVSAIPDSEISSPESFSIWPWWFLAGIPALQGEGREPCFVWGLESEASADVVGRWENVSGWSPSAGTKALLDSGTMTRPPIRTGDVLALPLTSAEYENEPGVGTTIGEKLLLLSADLDEPVAVDPAAPVLSTATAAGISPYVSWSGWLLGRRPAAEDAPQFRDDLPGKPPRVYDLRSGTLVDIAVDEPRPPEYWWASVVAGPLEEKVAIDGDPPAASLYLADLTTGRAERLLEGDVPRQIGLSEDWLLWIDSAGDLLGHHLPDLAPVRVPEVLALGEYDFDQNLQICGDLVLLTVVALDPNADAIGPSSPPMWTAVRLVRLR